MQIKSEQLISQLKNKPQSVVWIAGDETLLVQEACDTLRKYAKQEGYLTREILDVTPSFDWNQLSASSHSMSLFADKKLIDLRLPSSKLDNIAKKALQAYVDDPGEDNLLLISSPKVEKASTNAKWFKAIESKAGFVQIWPVNAQNLPGWIGQRLKQHGLSADPQAIQVIVQRVEGNLLAAAQEVEKLRMLVDDTHLDAQTVSRAVADSSRFNVFALIDATIAGQTPRALNILYHLKAEGGEPLQILNMLCRELRTLSRMSIKIEQGQNINGVMQSERVWSNRTQAVRNALSTHNIRSLEDMLEDAKSIDQSAKGLLNLNPWDEIIDLVMKLAGTQTCLKKANA